MENQFWDCCSSAQIKNLGTLESRSCYLPGDVRTVVFATPQPSSCQGRVDVIIHDR